MVTIRVRRRGRITLPSELLRKLSLHEGDRLVVISQGDQVILHPITKTLLDLRGSVPVSAAQNYSAIHEQVIGDRAEKIAREGN